jgi:AcrR family transcriptional regulator
MLPAGPFGHPCMCMPPTWLWENEFAGACFLSSPWGGLAQYRRLRTHRHCMGEVSGLPGASYRKKDPTTNFCLDNSFPNSVILDSTDQSIHNEQTFMNRSATSDVKETIIRESTRLFLENGFRGASVKEITKAAGIGRGTLYWYFKSKDEILETIFRRFERQFVDGFIEAVQNCNGDFIAKYKAFHRFTARFVRDNRDLSLAFHTVMSEVTGTNTRAEIVTREIWERFRVFLEGMLEEGKREGAIPAELDSLVCAHVIMATQAGMLVQWFLYGESLDAPAFVRTARDFLLKGMTGRER